MLGKTPNLSPQDAYREAKELAEEVERLGVALCGNRKAARGMIDSDFGLGRWFRSLLEGTPATIHLHLYCRLCAALEELNERQRRRVEHNERIIRELRKNRNAAFAPTREMRRAVGAEGGAAI